MQFHYSQTMSNPQTPPGWYPDPYGAQDLRRYWDGTEWTHATQPAAAWEESGPGQPQEPAGSAESAAQAADAGDGPAHGDADAGANAGAGAGAASAASGELDEQ